MSTNAECVVVPRVQPEDATAQAALIDIFGGGIILGDGFGQEVHRQAATHSELGKEVEINTVTAIGTEVKLVMGSVAMGVHTVSVYDGEGNAVEPAEIDAFTEAIARVLGGSGMGVSVVPYEDVVSGRYTRPTRADEGFRVAHEPFVPDNWYAGPTGQLRIPAVLVAIFNNVGFEPGKWFRDEVKVAWDGLSDEELAATNFDMAHDRQRAGVGLAYTTDTKAVLRCHMDEADPQPNVDDANRLIEATRIALARYGITAATEPLSPDASL